MTRFDDKPIPIINLQTCDGCGLCVRACPNIALRLQDGKAFVAHPLTCEYSGLCEALCPTLAISRPFEIVVVNIEDQQKAPSNSTKVVEGNQEMEYTVIDSASKQEN